MNLRPHGPQPCALPSYAIPRNQQMLLYQNFSKNQHFFRKFFGLEPKYFRKADEKDLIPLPEPLTYKDGAQVACGFGTVYEAIEKIGISGNHTVLVTGLGPVGLAALMLARAMGADKLIGVEMNDYRIDLAQKLGLADKIIKPGEGALEEILEATGGHGAERAIDASANDQARQLAVRGTRDWVTSLWKKEELTEHLVRWNIHPEKLITHEFPLEQAGEAYALMAGGNCGKVAVTF